jgi:hypothetical protein
MGDIHHEFGADRIGDVLEALEVYYARVSGITGNDELGLVFLGQPFDLREIQPFRLFIYVVVDEIIGLAGKGYRGAVGQVAAVGKVHGHDRIAVVDHGEIGRHVGL